MREEYRKYLFYLHCSQIEKWTYKYQLQIERNLECNAQLNEWQQCISLATVFI